MPRRMTEAEREAFLAEPRTAIISVASGGDRPPLAVPIHYAYEPGGDITFFTNTEGRTSRKSELIARAGEPVRRRAQHGVGGRLQFRADALHLCRRQGGADVVHAVDGG